MLLEHRSCLENANIGRARFTMSAFMGRVGRVGKLGRVGKALSENYPYYLYYPYYPQSDPSATLMLRSGCPPQKIKPPNIAGIKNNTRKTRGAVYSCGVAQK